MSVRTGSVDDTADWARIYRPLAPRGLLVQLAVLVGAEVLLFQAYAAHDSRFHWATHFLLALLVAAGGLSLHLLLTGRPARGQLLVVLGLHVVAMFPDLLFRAGVPHYRWMDVFLLHVTSHYLPGGDTSWLLLALAGLFGYALLLSRWLASHRPDGRSSTWTNADRDAARAAIRPNPSSPS